MSNSRIISLFFLISLSVSSCTLFKKKSNSSSSLVNDKTTNSPLIFTEFHRGYNTNNRAIELYNNSSDNISLSEYKINIYKQNETDPHISISLEGSLKPYTTYVIVYSESEQELKNKADRITDQLMVDGSWPVLLMHNNEVADSLGKVGFQYDYSINADIARKKEFLVGREIMDTYDWIKYDADNIDMLGTVAVTLSEEELLMGPKLTADDFATPFIQDGYGGGGAMEVTLAYTGDGDTSNFNIPSSQVGEYLYSRESVRYYAINTPEIQHGDEISAEPWGNAAKKYNNNVLKNAKKFALQTLAGGSFRDTYDRLLAFVWYSNKSNPEPEDYVLLNFEMVREAYAFMYFAKNTENRYTMFYKSLSYIHFIENAELRAKNNGWKIHGEKDPDFQY